ncbi:MAG: GTPase [Candidatus Odinarchaeota archaeon]
MAYKILLVGRPGTGKTTIKNVVFLEEDANELILFPLESTMNANYSLHNFLDVKISLLDTAGQFLPKYLINEEEQMDIFGDASVVIYLFSYDSWIFKKEQIISDITKIYEIIQKNEVSTKIILFIHKIDKIPQFNEELKESIEEEINKSLNLPQEFKKYFTSFHPNYLFTIYNALFEVLSSLSEEISLIKNTLMKIISKLSNTICYITNKNNYIINQIGSYNFDKKASYSYLVNASQIVQYDILPLIHEINSKLHYVAIQNIEDINPNLKNLLILSETLDNNELNELMKNIIVKIKKNV